MTRIAVNRNYDLSAKLSKRVRNIATLKNTLKGQIFAGRKFLRLKGMITMQQRLVDSGFSILVIVLIKLEKMKKLCLLGKANSKFFPNQTFLSLK